MIIKNRKLLTTPPIDTLPIGTIQSFVGTTPPSGYLLADGSQKPIAKYQELALLCGNQFNNGKTPDPGYFYLPDLKGKTIVGVNSNDVEFNIVGKLFGNKTHTLTINEMPNHTHIQNAHTHIQGSHYHWGEANTGAGGNHSHTMNFGGYTGTGQGNGVPVLGTTVWGRDTGGMDTQGNHTHYVAFNTDSRTPVIQAIIATNQATGEGIAHNNIQPSVALNYIIKAEMIANIVETNIYDGLDSESTSKALSANQGNVIKEILDVIGESSTISLTDVQTITVSSQVKLNLTKQDTRYSQSPLLTISNNGIKIGKGIKKVRVDLEVWAQSADGQYTSIHILKNGTQITYEMAPPTNNAGHRWRSIYSYANIDVVENDVIYGYIRFSDINATLNTANPYDNSTRLSVTVLK